MKFHITVNDEDYIAFNICHYLSLPANKRNFVMSHLKAIVISVVFILLLCLLFRESDKLFLITLFALLLIFYVSIFTYSIICYPRKVRTEIRKYVENLKKEGGIPGVGNCTVEFMEEEMHTTLSYGFQCRKYSDVTRILRDEEHIYIVVGAAEAEILPLRCLEGRENELLDFLNSKLQKNGPQSDSQV